MTTILATTLLLNAVLLMQPTPQPPTKVRSIYIAGWADEIGPNRKVGTCLMYKLQALGPFTFTTTSQNADAVLTLAIQKGR